MAKVYEQRPPKVLANQVVAQALPKVLHDAKARMQSADQRRAADIKRITEIKQRF